MLENKTLWKVLKIFPLRIFKWFILRFYGKIKFAFCAFIWEEFMDLAKDFGVKVNKNRVSKNVDLFRNRYNSFIY